jgi:hypothetical protein
MTQTNLPELPFNQWKETRLTLHLILQIIGKARLKLTTRKNHWWNVTIYVTPNGFSTHNIPIDMGMNSIEIELDIKRKAIIITHSSKEEIKIALHQGYTVADFYVRLMGELANFGLKPKFINKPLDLGIEKPFDQITEYHHYSWPHIEKFWQIMLWNNYVFQDFSGRFYGKTCPVHIYWHHLDLTVTRFSGKKLPPVDKSARILERDTYSHEQISFGFWAGDDNMQEPMYYSYTYPSPDNLDSQLLAPSQAYWQDSNGSPMALMRYADVRNSENPNATVLEFLESAYLAGAKLAGWNIKELRTPSLDEI